MIHKPWLQVGSASAWAGADLRILLLHEASTAAPAVGDLYVADLVPASNELVNDDYARVALTGKAATWNGTDGVWELEADDVDFGLITGDPGTQGVSGWALYVHVTNDADSRLVRTYTGTPTLLTGDHVRVTWTDGIVLTVEG